MLNDEKEIFLQIEWDPVTEDTENDIKGHVTGYYNADNSVSFMEKGLKEVGPLDECDLRYGIILTDVYRRQFVTEMIGSHITE